VRKLATFTQTINHNAISFVSVHWYSRSSNVQFFSF